MGNRSWGRNREMGAGMAEIWNQDLRKHVVAVIFIRWVDPEQRRRGRQTEAEEEEEARTRQDA